MEQALPLAAVIIALAGFIWGVFQMRNSDLRLIEARRKEDRDIVEKRLSRTEDKLSDCERGREALLRENVEFMRQIARQDQRIAELEAKLAGGMS